MPYPVTTYAMTGAFGAVLTSTTGSNFTLVGSAGSPQIVKRVIFANDTGVDLEVQRNQGITSQSGSNVGLPIFNRSYVSVEGINKLDDLSVRRIDQSNTQAVVKFTWEN